MPGLLFREIWYTTMKVKLESIQVLNSILLVTAFFIFYLCKSLSTYISLPSVYYSFSSDANQSPSFKSSILSFSNAISCCKASLPASHGSPGLKQCRLWSLLPSTNIVIAQLRKDFMTASGSTASHAELTHGKGVNKIGFQITTPSEFLHT